MNKLREAAELALDALENVFGKGKRCEAAITALRQALAAKDECETCANKRKRLTEAGLLKSPIRGIAEGPGYEPVVFTNMNSVGLLIGTNEVMRVTGDGITFSDRVDPIDTSSTCVDETEKREHEPVGTVLNVQWMSSAGGWEIGFHSKRKLFKGEALYTAHQEQGCAECGKKASDGWALYCVKCAETFAEQEPVAWTLTEFLDKRETTTNAPLWFVDPVNSAWTPLYTAPPSKLWIDLSVDEIYQAADREDQSYGFVQGALWAEAALIWKRIVGEDQKAFVDQLKYGQSFMLDGKRIDPKDIYMDKPHALRLADALAQLYKTPPSIKEAAAELRRLHQVNQELVGALKDMLSGWKYIRETHGDLSGVGWDRAQNKAEIVLIKLKEQA